MESKKPERVKKQWKVKKIIGTVLIIIVILISLCAVYLWYQFNVPIIPAPPDGPPVEMETLAPTDEEDTGR